MRARHDVLFYAQNVGPLLRPGEGLPTGGAETQVVLIARELVRRGFRVAIAVHDVGLPSSVEGIDLIVHRALRGGLPGVRSAKVLARTLQVVRQADAPVVIHSNASVETGYVGLATRLTRRRFVFAATNVVDFDLGRIEPSRFKLAGFRAGVRLAHDIVAQTEEQVGLAAARFGRSATHIPCVAEPAGGRRSSPEAFLWVGRLAAYKRPHAYLDLAESLPEARFRMVGVPSGADGPRLARELADRAGSLPNVELLEPRQREALAPLYDRAVAVVNTAEFEGMPNVFLEAWARGVPALALEHDPDGMIVREHLGAFAAGDPNALVAHARTLWQARGDSYELSERCIAHMRAHHSLAAVADRWVDLLFGAGRDD
jgi:glycosyltransferase involved in cell wall biosynthesis